MANRHHTDARRRTPAIAGSLRAGLLGVVLCCAATAAAEQEPDAIVLEPEELPAPGEPAPAKPQRVIDEMIVTATKREKSARDIPMSIDAFSGEELVDMGATEIEEYIKFSPGVTMNNWFGPDVFSVQIRGVTTGSSGRPTGLFLDDIPLTNPSILGSRPDIDAFDLAQIEVIKGPVGTLFGGSALAGGVRFIPNRPKLDAREAKAFIGITSSASSGDLGQSAGFMFNQPFSDTLGARLVGVVREWPGVFDDLTPGVEQRDVDFVRKINGRGLVSWHPTERLSIDGMLHWWDVWNPSIAMADNPDRLERSNTPGPQRTENDEKFGQLKLQYDFDKLALTFTGNLIDKKGFKLIGADRLFELAPAATGSNVIQRSPLTAEAFTYELRVQSEVPTDSPFRLLNHWSWLAGAFYFQSDQFFDVGVQAQVEDPTALLLGIPLLGDTREQATTDFGSAVSTEFAIFGDFTRTVGAAQRWELNFGLRYFDQLTDSLAISIFTPVGETGVNPDERFEGEARERGFNPKLALKYRVAEKISIYGSAARGYRFGGINTVGIVARNVENIPQTYESDLLWSYEIGARSEWFQRRLQADAALFLIDWRNLQVSQRTDSFGTLFIDNVGAAKNIGAELALRAILPWNLSLTVNGGYLDAKITTPFESSSSGFVPAGTRLPAAPEWTGSATLAYAGTFHGTELGGSVSASYQSDSFDELGTSSDRLPGYSTFNASVRVGVPRWPMAPELSLSVINLTDQRPHTFIFQHEIHDMSQDYFFIRPRTVKFNLSGSF